jgi:hypothetical protein
MVGNITLDTDENGVPMLIDKARAAIGKVESEGSGGYLAIGPRTKSGDRAYGKYQVMGKNIPLWTKEVFGQAMTAEQFLADPKAQDAVFNAKFGEYVQKYGSVNDAASMWFSGLPYAKATAQGRKDNLGTTVQGYVDKFKSAFGGGPLSAADPTFVGNPNIHVEPNYEAPHDDQSEGAVTDTSSTSNVMGDLLTRAFAPEQTAGVENTAAGIGDMTGGMFGQADQDVNNIAFGQRMRKPWPKLIQ